MRFRLNSLEDTRDDRSIHVRNVLGENPVAFRLVKLAEDFLVRVYCREMFDGFLDVMTATGDLEQKPPADTHQRRSRLPAYEHGTFILQLGTVIRTHRVCKGACAEEGGVCRIRGRFCRARAGRKGIYTF